MSRNTCNLQSKAKWETQIHIYTDKLILIQI